MANPNNLNTDPVPEAEQIARAVRTWLSTYPGKPFSKLDVEFLGEGTGLTISTVQAAYKTKTYICGGYLAQYQFSILYQTIPNTTGERLEADEVLNNYAAWAVSTAGRELPSLLPPQCKFKNLTRNTVAALLGRDATGAEVHQTTFTLLYEVNI